MKTCDYCGGFSSVNEPLEKYTNQQGWTECHRHKDIRACIWKFRFDLDRSWFKWLWIRFWSYVARKR